MKADEMRLAELLGGRQQYAVPYFQRAYSWRRRQWETLWDDILELNDAAVPMAHFLGSMVLLSEGVTEGLENRLVIDGQQRIVTLSLLLAAMRDLARDVEPGLAERLDASYLRLPGADSPKVQPTYQDRDAYARVISNDTLAPSPISDAYRVFQTDLRDGVDKGLDLNRLERIILSQLSFVAITLDPEDNPYRIFESLNAKGMPLTQGDLLRNYFFMRLPTAEHESIYASLWSPMQTLLGARFDDFMRDFLLKEGETVRPEEVYQTWRKRLSPLGEEDIRAVLRDLKEWSTEYDKVLHPQRETNPQVRQRLERLTTWSNTLEQPFNPFLLRLRSDYSRGVVPADPLAELLLGVESFLVRRLFVAPPAVDVNQLLIDLYNQASRSEDRVGAFLEQLSNPRVGWPGDPEFTASVLRYPLYFGSHPDQRRLVVQALEESYPHRFPPHYADYDLELVVPLMPSKEWLAELGVDEEQHWKLVGTLGNFTFYFRNRSPSRGIAERKKDFARLARNGLELVKDVAAADRWSGEMLEDRSRRLAERALEVWPGPRR